MTASALYRKLDLSFPNGETPTWAPLVDRWYQLDAYAFGLAETYFTLKEPDETPPSLIVLGSAGASNETDFHFARTGAISPSKFVHTLPNIRGSTLCQLMGWKGPLICIQNDPRTQITALAQGLELLDESMPRIWVFSVSGKYTVHWFELSVEADLAVIPTSSSRFRVEPGMTTEDVATDSDFQAWLIEPGKQAFSLPGAFTLKRL